jgi:prepilin-type N-terminal cleavage/methylation domain-containing protein/prepilin-type processing-associated H-X9-DG protein
VKKRFRGFTLIELLVVIAIIALLISILLPSLSRARELSKRLVCASNIKGVGTSCKIYANENQEKWPIPPFKQSAIDNGGIRYLGNSENDQWPSNVAPGNIGYNREFESYSEVGRDISRASTAISTTRAYWMLVRTGDVTVKQYICPSSGDNEDPTENLALYYDFTGYRNISYGYQVPYGPRDTQPREGMDNRQPLAADKGPFYASQTNPPTWRDANDRELTVDSSPESWAQYNSPNHGGRGQGEGQNVLYADGHASFLRTPLGGIDSDNIYTVILNEWDDVRKLNLIHGSTPHEYGANQPPYPGQEAVGTGAGAYSSTDTLIYP